MMNDLCTSCFAGHLEASEFQQTLLVCTTCGFVTEALEVLEQQEYQAGLAPLREQSQGRQRDAASVVPVHRLRKVGVREVGDSVKDWVVMTRGCLSEGAARIGRVLLRGGNDDDDDEVDDDDDDDDDVDEGADERLGAIAEDIWWRLVAHSGVLEEAAWEGVVEEIARTDKERNQDSRHVVFERFLRNRVGFDTVYAILFVGCLIERYPIDVFDVSTLFMSTGALRPDRAAQTEVIERNLASREFLRRDGVPSPVRLYLDARQLVSQLGIVLPPLNVHAWLARFDGGDGHDGGCDVRAQVMAGLYCSNLRLDSGPPSGLMPWSVLVSANVFDHGKYARGSGKACDGGDLLLPRDANYVPQRIGRARLQKYTDWFVERINGSRPSDVIEGDDGSFDFVLDRVARGVQKLEAREARDARDDRPTATSGPRGGPRGGARSPAPSVPWCYVSDQTIPLDKIASENEAAVRRHLEDENAGDGDDNGDGTASWEAFVAGYEAKQDEVRRRVDALLSGTEAGGDSLS